MHGKWMYRVILLISVLTIASGLGQVFFPRFVLHVMNGDATATSAHFFGIIGMFMVLFGGLLLQSLLTAGNNSTAVLWAGLQKFGAAGAVGLAVARGILSPLALGVAAFDLFSGVLIMMYRARVKKITLGQSRSL